jgi:hypothetical protein
MGWRGSIIILARYGGMKWMGWREFAAADVSKYKRILDCIFRRRGF